MVPNRDQHVYLERILGNFDKVFCNLGSTLSKAGNLPNIL